MTAATATTPSPPTPYELIGGEAGVRKLVAAFYDVMDSAEAAAGIRSMHAADLGPVRERLGDWLVGWMGGPALYQQRHPQAGCIMSVHGPYDIGPDEADRWMACMRQAMEECGCSEELSAMLDPAFSAMTQGLRKR